MRIWHLRVVLLAVAVGLAVALWPWPAPRVYIDEADLQRVQAGMTEAEVEGLLGCPEGNYITEDDVWPVRAVCGMVRAPQPGEVTRSWTTNAWWITIEFDNRGRVRDVTWTPCVRVPLPPWHERLWEKLRQCF